DQPAGLQPVNGLELAEIGHVEVLPADHAIDTGRSGQRRGGGQYVLRIARLRGEQVVERLRVQRIAGQDRDVLPELDVAGRPAATQLVVVHRRQVVVNQRVGVDQLDRRGQRQDV